MFWSIVSIFSFAEESLFATELISISRERLSSSSRSLRALFSCEKLITLSFTSCSNPLTLESLSAKACSSLASISISKLLLLLANSLAISEICLWESLLNTDILSAFCCSFSWKLSSKEFWRSSTEFLNFDNLSELFWSSVSILRVISESFFWVSALDSDILLSFCCSFSWKLSSREFWRSSTEFSNFDNLSELFWSSVSILRVISESFFWVSALDSDILLSFCCSFS